MAGKSASVPKKNIPKKKKANGYKMPDPIPRGEIITDLTKKQWIIGESIGIGGFGEIYSAAEYLGKTPKEYPAVVKIEPHENGPLFVERSFYMRNAKPSEIEDWKKKRKLSHLGMPKFLGFGSHLCHNTKYRFLVMERYGTDLWKLFVENGRRFSEPTVYKIALQTINVLEYIHNKTYVHADIKGSNLLLSMKSQNFVYLVDFGLASHYTKKTDYKLDPKKAHNGTIEYTSRDAHMGVPTMRGDFEILFYNIIQWLCGALPWENNLKDPSAVHREKNKVFENTSNFLKQCFPEGPPAPISEYVNLLTSLEFDDKPDYEKFRQILTHGLQKLGSSADGKLEFTGGTKVATKLITTPKIVKKTSELVAKRKSPRVKAPLDKSSPVRSAPPSLDDSTIGIVVDKKREGVKGLKKILETIDDDSDAEYDICITKKRKVKQIEDKAATPKTASAKKGRRKAVTAKDIDDPDDSSELVINPTKGSRSRPKNPPVKKTSRKQVVTKANTDESNSDADMFDDRNNDTP